MSRRKKRSQRSANSRKAQVDSSSIQQLPWRQMKLHHPPLEILTGQQLLAVDTAAMRILKHTGLRFQNDEALSILESNGAEVNFETGCKLWWFANTITADKVRGLLIKLYKYRRLVCLIVPGIMFLAGNSVVWAQSLTEMQQRYAAFVAGQTDDSLPFTLESRDKDGVISASVTTFLPEMSFSLFAQRLSSVAEWCEFIPLHLNVKACMYEMGEGVSKLGFYLGAKDYMTPDEAELLLLNFNARPGR